MTTYKQTLSSNGRQVSLGNDIISFTNNVQYFRFQTFGQPCSIILNNETNSHYIDTNSEFIISDYFVGKFKIIDAGVTYQYMALSID